MKKSIMLVLLIVIIPCMIMAQEGSDILKTVLDSAGFDRSDIGFHPQGYWNRYPLDIPYKLTSFEALFSEPFKLIDYTETMAFAVEKYMNPAFFDSSSNALYYLTYSLGVDRKLGGFRNYSADLIPVVDSVNPLDRAMERLFLLADEQPQYYSFGAETGWPPYYESLAKLRSLVDPRTELILAGAVLNLTDIIRWRNLAFRNCDIGDMQRAFKIRSLASTQSDGTVYYPEIDDLAGTIDLPSLHYAALKASALVKETADSLRAGLQFPPDQRFELRTPFGRIILIGKNYFDANKIESLNLDDCLLVVDFGADGTYTGSIGATGGIDNPVSIFLDLGGNDVYESRNDRPSAGAGIMGIGVLYDDSGDDRYDTRDVTQGCGFFGVGILCDRLGKDTYRAKLSAQGCGYFGIGLCFDGSGDDDYYCYGDGQGYGGVGGGVGVLADYSGDDKYTGEPYSSVYNRGDYHSDNKINGNGVQGVGFGRRGDGSDGHSWAGGLGAIIDILGNDHYRSGNWSLGCGYWFATGIAFDKEGDDYYESCYFTQGSGAHYCNGILMDEGGNDRHELFETAGAALGFGWDYTNAFLINLGGDDSYYAKMISMGVAQIRSNAFLIDIGGNDKYLLKDGAVGLGEATFREDYKKPRGLAPYYTYSNSFGGFIDIRGIDEYLSFDEKKEKNHPRAANDKIWFAPAKTDSTYGANNYGVGIDTENGFIPEIEKWGE